MSPSLEYEVSKFRKYVQTLRKGFVDISETLEPDKERIGKFDCKDPTTGKPILRAYVLPKDSKLSFPSKMPQKQISLSSGFPILFERLDGPSQERIKRAIERILDNSWGSRRHVVTLGYSIIGKSAETAVILNQFLLNLGKEGWPRTVYYRVPKYIVSISVDVNGLVSVSGQHSADVNGIMLSPPDLRSSILFLELAELEADPAPNIPSYYALSASEADSRTAKTAIKMGGSLVLLSEPPSREQVMAMAQTFLDFKMPLGRAIGAEGDGQAILKEINDRMNIVGPIPGILFDEMVYADRIQKLKQLSKFTKVPNFTEVRPYNIPQELEPFAGIFFKNDGNDVACVEKINGIYMTRLLSDYIACLVALAVKTDAEELMLHQCLVHFHIAEIIMKHFILLKSPFEGMEDSFVENTRHEKWSRTHCTYRMDLGYVIDSFFPISERQILFYGMYWTYGSVRDLEEKILYVAKSHNFALGKCFAVDHNTKTLYMYQSTAKDISTHEIKASTLWSVLKHFHMLKGMDGQVYNLKIIFFSDLSKNTKFLIDVSEEVTRKAFSDVPNEKKEALKKCFQIVSLRDLRILSKITLKKSKKSVPQVKSSDIEICKRMFGKYDHKDITESGKKAQMTPGDIALTLGYWNDFIDFEKIENLIVQCIYYPHKNIITLPHNN